MPEFARFLKGQLAARGWSYSDLARRAGLHSSLVSRVMRGERCPTRQFVQRAAEALGVPLAEAMAAAGYWDAALTARETAEARALLPYVEYAATAEGQAEIADRLPAKLAKVSQVADATGKVAILVAAVADLARRLQAASGTSAWLIGGALLYFISPVDLVPDFLPAGGLLDDLAVVMLVLHLVTTRRCDVEMDEMERRSM